MAGAFYGNGKGAAYLNFSEKKKSIEKSTMIDLVQVVRCKDCKYRDGTPGQPNILCYQMHDDDFCSYGEQG